ncbi:hypothetical protein ACFQRL_14360 [Microbacterium fluvii]|uniref:Chromosome partition protein Smc n=1 Tax=Microbacterium fluvii TaxID=415215 RepID=A0ABW2HG81_9MICO|nr:hypothetical protein [Microbacterium fluvii]MCU4673774.1 hypothetical protein [Microbacterium fluvii]
MPEPLADALRWLVPALVVFVSAALALAIIGWAIRRARRGPAARARAEESRSRAGVALVHLDDALAELELEVGLSGALHGGDAPASLRRARLTAQHARDEGFETYRAISDERMLPAEVRRQAERLEQRAAAALHAIARARDEHRSWVRAHLSAADQVAAAQRRLADARSAIGDPAALVAELAARFDESEWRAASSSAHAALAHVADAQRQFDLAAEAAADPTRDALTPLAAGERAAQQAEAESHSLEEAHRLVLQAAQALPEEFASARGALTQAQGLLPRLEPDAAQRLTDELREVDERLTALEPEGARRPTRTVDAIARLRGRLDLAVGDARTAQQRLRGARTALPGTLAAARHAIAAAEASVSNAHAGADARVRLAAAQRELAAARQSTDPVDALDAARRALRDAEDAKALGDYAKTTR